MLDMVKSMLKHQRLHFRTTHALASILAHFFSFFCAIVSLLHLSGMLSAGRQAKPNRMPFRREIARAGTRYSLGASQREVFQCFSNFVLLR